MIAHPQMFDAQGSELHLGDLVRWSTAAAARYRIIGWGMLGPDKYVTLRSVRSGYRTHRKPHLAIRV